MFEKGGLPTCAARPETYRFSVEGHPNATYHFLTHI